MSDPLALATARYASEILMMPKRCGHVNAKRMPQPRLLGTVTLRARPVGTDKRLCLLIDFHLRRTIKFYRRSY